MYGTLCDLLVALPPLPSPPHTSWPSVPVRRSAPHRTALHALQMFMGAWVNDVSGLFFGRGPFQTLSLRVYNMPTVSTISRPRLLGAGSVYRLQAALVWCMGKRTYPPHPPLPSGLGWGGDFVRYVPHHCNKASSRRPSNRPQHSHNSTTTATGANFSLCAPQPFRVRAPKMPQLQSLEQLPWQRQGWELFGLVLCYFFCCSCMDVPCAPLRFVLVASGLNGRLLSFSVNTVVCPAVFLVHRFGQTFYGRCTRERKILFFFVGGQTQIESDQPNKDCFNYYLMPLTQTSEEKIQGPRSNMSMLLVTRPARSCTSSRGWSRTDYSRHVASVMVQEGNDG